MPENELSKNASDGISLENKRNFGSDKKEDLPDGMFSRKPEDRHEEEPQQVEPVQPEKEHSPKDLARHARLEAKLVNAKAVNYSGFAVNGGSIVVLLFGIDNFIGNPDNISMMQGINDTFGFGFDVEGALNKVQEFKAQIIGFCVSIQTFFAYWQDVCQKMKNADREDTFTYINEELGKMGI